MNNLLFLLKIKFFLCLPGLVNNIKSILTSSLSSPSSSLHASGGQPHPVSLRIALFTQSSRSPGPSQLTSLEVSLSFSSQNLLFQWGLGQTSPARPNGQGQQRYPPQRNRGVFGNERGTIVSRWSSGKKEEQQAIREEQNTKLSGAHCIFKASHQLGEIILKSESFFS